MTVAATAVAEFDGDDRLRAADPALAALNDRAGGAIGERLAVPQLAAAVRLARRLGVVVSRAATIADAETDWDVWVRASPDAGGVRLTVSDWRERRMPVLAPVPAADAWRWQCDAALRVTHASAELAGLLGSAPEGRAAEKTLGLPAGTLSSRRSFAMEGTPGSVRLVVEGVPLHDPAGRFAGFTGSARAVAESVAGTDEPASADTFTTGLDRALRRPLARIIANADSIAAQTEGPIASEYAQYAGDIAGAGRHLLALVDDLVDMQAVERPGFTLAVETIDLADLARRAAGLLSVRAEEAEVAIERPALEVTAPALGDFRRVLQILVNLAGNAVRYAPRGTQVVLTADAGTVSVSDKGRGIAVEDQARVFDKFARLDPGEAGGSGLGLYIARRLARAMGGDLSVESAPGEGARFVLRLKVGEGT